MCGITGIYSKMPIQNLAAKTRQVMQAIAHRGPDGEGLFVSKDGRISFGHKRLAIIDPNLAAQPMNFVERGLTITFNGCIYNYIELRAELQGHDYHFKTNSDTEVILKAYAHWGTECVKKFNGIWAFAIWDAHQHILFCSRDRMGVKPFFYFLKKELFLFCSEIKGILQSGFYQAEVNHEALQNYLAFQFYMEDETLFKGVKELKPGYNLIFKGRNCIVESYWDMKEICEVNKTESEFTEELENILTDSIRLNLRADVKIGAFLSGGLDSSAIVCYAKKLMPHLDLKIFSGAFNEGSLYDETKYSKIIAQETGYEHTISYFNEIDFAKNIQKIIWHMDQPQAGPGVFPQYLISKEASKQVKVVLGGQGGDEVFVGYVRYLMLMLSRKFKGVNIEAETLKIKSNPYLRNYENTFMNFMKKVNSGVLQYPENYFHLINKNACFEEGLYKNSVSQFMRLFSSLAGAGLKKALLFDLKTNLKALLAIEDRVTMAFGLESRVPLLDYRIVEWMLSIPEKIFFKNQEPKFLFKQAIKHCVPEKILNRQDKMGFPVPLNQWGKTMLKEFITDTLSSPKALQRNIFSKQYIEEQLCHSTEFGRELWGILSLELWFQTFIDQKFVQ